MQNKQFRMTFDTCVCVVFTIRLIYELTHYWLIFANTYQVTHKNHIPAHDTHIHIKQDKQVTYTRLMLGHTLTLHHRVKLWHSIGGKKGIVCRV